MGHDQLDRGAPQPCGPNVCGPTVRGPNLLEPLSVRGFVTFLFKDLRIFKDLSHPGTLPSQPISYPDQTQIKPKSERS